ncbi:MAG: SMC-Scp complex subunit ScpB [Alphaproteobacteria bacterium 32-64-14]|nr:MAG: SMC-Scp complex subunit ScpB [Alphaproteobacteria bacterium 32-64-14]
MSGEEEKPDLKAMRDAVAKLAKQRKTPAPEGAPAAEAAPKLARPVTDPEKLSDALRRAEAVLFASNEAVDATTLAEALPPGVEAGDVLLQLKADYSKRGVQLVELAGKWRFQTAPDLAFLFEETREQPRALSRAALETLAIIAYCQPVTRAEIEDVRGVAVSSGTIDILMEAGWIRPRGRRRTPGRPVTFGVTDAFLVHFGLDSIDSLPGRDELKASGLLSADIPRDFEFAGTPRDPETGELLGEDALEDSEFQSDFLEGAEDRG